MPNYDFRCNKCQAEFEKRVSYSQIGSVPCPDCGSTDKKQIFRAGAVKGPVGGASSAAPSSAASFGSGGFS